MIALLLLSPPHVVSMVGGGIMGPPDIDGGTGSVVKECPPGEKAYISFPCQQQRLILGPEGVSCDLYYCASDAGVASGNNNVGTIGHLVDADPFESEIELSSPTGIASLVATGLQLFLGAVAVYSVILAVKSALLLADAANADGYVQAKNNMSYGIVGLLICGGAVLLLQLVINFFGLGNIDDVFRTIGPVLNASGRA